MSDINQSTFVYIGSDQAMSSCSTWRLNTVSGFVTCHSETQGSLTVDSGADMTPARDIYTGSWSKLPDFLNNNSDFTMDNTYDDIDYFRRYNSTLSGMDYFNLTFPRINLIGNELGVAYLALSLSDLGQTFCVMAYSSETNLIKLCEEQKWNYEIVN